MASAHFPTCALLQTPFLGTKFSFPTDSQGLPINSLKFLPKAGIPANSFWYQGRMPSNNHKLTRASIFGTKNQFVFEKKHIFWKESPHVACYERGGKGWLVGPPKNRKNTLWLATNGLTHFSCQRTTQSLLFTSSESIFSDITNMDSSRIWILMWLKHCTIGSYYWTNSVFVKHVLLHISGSWPIRVRFLHSWSLGSWATFQHVCHGKRINVPLVLNKIQQSGKSGKVVPKRKVAENPHRFDLDRTKIGLNPNVFAYSKSSWTGANMHMRVYEWNLLCKSPSWCKKTEK